MSRSTEPESTHRTPNTVAGAGVVSAFAALVGASCCVLPIILFQLGIGSALIGTLTLFAQSTVYFLIAATAFIAVGVIASFWNGQRPGRTAIALFALATGIVVAAYLLPSYEGEILRALGFR